MQDRFKFRIWDDDNECFDYLDFNDLEKAKHTIDSYNEYFWSGYFKENPRYLMQSTGLKDKNGKLIYEGDIVNIYDRFIDKIIFHKGCFCVSKGSYNQATYWKDDTMEVIGNIYENKELLDENRNK